MAYAFFIDKCQKWCQIKIHIQTIHWVESKEKRDLKGEEKNETKATNNLLASYIISKWLWRIRLLFEFMQKNMNFRYSNMMFFANNGFVLILYFYTRAQLHKPRSNMNKIKKEQHSNISDNNVVVRNLATELFTNIFCRWAEMRWELFFFFGSSKKTNKQTARFVAWYTNKQYILSTCIM